MPRGKPQFRPLFLFEDMEGEPRKALTEIMPLDFESYRVRMFVVKGMTWWVLSDVARILGYRDAANAGRVLRAHQKGTHLVSTPGGDQEMAVANESGVYRLILRSNRPEAERFQDWLTDEVLPSIRRTGSYSTQPRSRVAKMAKKLKTDRDTAKIRCDQLDINRAQNLQLASEGAIPRDFANRHNAVYRGQFGMEAPQLRTALGLKDYRQTPLDHMDGLPLSQNYHSKFLAERQIREAGRQLSRQEQDGVFEETAREIAQADFAKLGAGYVYGVVDDPMRGKIVDIQRRQLVS